MITALAVAAILQTHQAPMDYTAEIRKFRSDLAESLKQENGWLSLTGLNWLAEGSTPFGLTASGALVLPTAGKHIGVFERVGDKVTLRVHAEVPVKLNGEPTKEAELKLNIDKVLVGHVTMMAIQRGTRIGIRSWDSQSAELRRFTGLKWYPINPKLRFKAKFTAYGAPQQLPITNVLGDTQPVENPGYVEFTVDGHLCRLEAESAGDGLFFNFADLTSGKTTYGAGRFLDAPKPVNGYVDLDFNKATNPPCAFTNYATCPLPPSANRLKVAITAGEKIYPRAH